MQKILVIGCPGSGKSTFARRLQALTGLPLIYLDQLFWNADQTTVSPETLDARIKTALAGDRWIIDGNYARTLEVRLQACDTVFFLDYPLDLCLRSVEARIGTVRPDMPWVEEALDPEFADFIRAFPQTTRPKILKLLEQYREKTIHLFHSRAEADQYLKTFPQGGENSVQFLTTDRLQLTNLRRSDGPAVHSYRSDPDCARYQYWEAVTPEAIDAYIARHTLDVFLSQAEEQHYAVRTPDGALAGELAVFHNPADNCITLGITIAPAHQRQGYAYEILAAVVQAAREKYPALDLVALIDRENEPSLRLFQKLGFTEECYTDSIRSYVYVIAAR